MQAFFAKAVEVTFSPQRPELKEKTSNSLAGGHGGFFPFGWRGSGFCFERFAVGSGLGQIGRRGEELEEELVGFVALAAGRFKEAGNGSRITQ
ncbi:MAG: hypothetical protein JWR26_1171 [Pedosphaera sp.]|nr:hypothetical protein [Pedosphaera sp.]